MEFLVLGPLQARGEGRPIEVRAPKQKALLGLLLVNANQVVSTDRLLEGAWHDQQPSGGVKTLQYHVSKLRDALQPERPRGDPGVVGTEAGGYVLHVDPHQVDAARFETMAVQGADRLRGGELAAARALLAEALGLWRGGAFEDFRYEQFAQGEIARLEEARLGCLENRIAADLELGRHREVVAELRELTTRFPLRERLWGQLMTALYRSDQQAGALRAFQAARSALGEELGIEPNAALRHLEEQILMHELPFEAPPVVAPARPDLPARVESFIGREEHIGVVENLVERHRLVTLTGFGGVGKTSLALQVARRLSHRYADGVGLVELAPLTDSRFVVGEMAATMGVREHPTHPLLEVMVDEVASRELLLVVDNCEHLANEAGRVISALLEGCPRLRVLATSREPLRLGGEQVWPVPPLDLPDQTAEPSLEMARQSDAVKLFADRAHQVHPGFELEEGNVGAVVTLCRRLDGVPLALELAAARLRLLSPAEVLHRLEDRFALLTAQQSRSSRHRSLWAAIEWSYELLDPSERVLLRRLAVFEGGFTLPAAEAVCSSDGIETSDVLGLLGRLVDASLISVTSLEPRRFGMLESVHEFAQAELASCGEEHAARAHHTDHFVTLIPEEVARESSWDTPQFVEALETLAAEQDNYRSALAWNIHVDDGERALQLGCRFRLHWGLHGLPQEALEWLPLVLETAPSLATAERVGVLISLGHALAFSPQRQEVVPLLEELIESTRQLDDALLSVKASDVEASLLYADSRPREAIALPLQHADVLRTMRSPGLTRLLLNAASGSIDVGDFAEATQYLDEAEACGWEFDQPMALALVLGNRGMLAHCRGDLHTAEQLLAESLGELRRLQRVNVQANTLREIVQVSLAMGKFEQAGVWAQELINVGRRMVNARDMAKGHVQIARAEMGLGNLEAAAEAAIRALRIALDSDDTWSLALLAATVGQIAAASDDPANATTLHATAETLRTQIGFVHPAPRSRELEREYDQLRDVLGADTYNSAWKSGTSLTTNGLATQAREVLGGAGATVDRRKPQ